MDKNVQVQGNYTSFNIIQREKTVIRHSVRRQPFSAVLQIMYRTFPIRAYADRENTALLPTERIRQKQRCRKRFSVACGIKSFNSLSWRSGFGGIKGEKERFVFERFFVGTERRKPLFALLLIYTAKNGKTALGQLQKGFLWRSTNSCALRWRCFPIRISTFGKPIK